MNAPNGCIAVFKPSKSLSRPALRMFSDAILLHAAVRLTYEEA